MEKQAAVRSNLLVIVLALAGTVAAMQQTLVVPLLPEFPKLLGTTVEGASWLVTVILLSGAVAVPIISRLADMYGKKRMMLVALVAMCVGSILGALSDTIQMLILGRVLQGIGVSLVPVGIAIMRDRLPPERLPLGVAVMSATLSFGAAAGLPLSGVISQSAGWQGVFWLSSALSAVLIVAIATLFRDSTVAVTGKFDWIGAIFLSLALTSLLLAISKGGEWGWVSARTLLLFLLGAALIGLLVPWELRAGTPLINLRVAMRPMVVLLNLSAVLIGFATFANMVVTVQLLQAPSSLNYGQGLDTLQAGLWMAPSSLMFAVMAPPAAAITRRVGPQMTLLTGAVIMAAAYVARVMSSATLIEIVGGSVIVSVGAALAFSGMLVSLMNSVPMTETASANGLNTLLRTVGSSLAGAAVAAGSSLGVIRIGGDVFPTFSALMLVFWISAGASLLASLLTLTMFRQKSYNVHLDMEPTDRDAVESSAARRMGRTTSGWRPHERT